MNKRKENLLSNKLLLGSLAAFTSESIYGLSFIFTKQATESASVFALIGWRFFIAFIFMTFLAMIGLVKVDLKGKNLKPLIIISLFCPIIYFIAESFEINYTTASESGVFIAGIPIASLLASTIILKKKPNKFEILGVFITLTGVLLTVVAVGLTSSLSIIGYSFLLAAIISYALYSVFVDLAKGYSSGEITYIMLSSGALVFVTFAMIEAVLNWNVLYLVTLPFENSGFLYAVLYQGIACSIFAFFMSNIAIANIGVNKTASFTGISTVVSIIAGAFILKENFTLLQYIGAGLILIGIYTANVKLGAGSYWMRD